MSELSIVCGATGGLGPAVVAALAGRGDQVIAVARSKSDLAALELSHPGQVRLETADLTSVQDVERLWAHLDGLKETPNWLVNLTGGFNGGSLVESKPPDFGAMLDLNLATTWWSCRAGAARMQAAGRGAIVNVGARAAIRAERSVAAYAVAKAGVVKLTEILAEELKASGVRVNAILPAVIDTAANRTWMSEADLRKAVAAQAIARVIAFLCSDGASPINGAIIPVYGRF